MDRSELWPSVPKHVHDGDTTSRDVLQRVADERHLFLLRLAQAAMRAPVEVERFDAS